MPVRASPAPSNPGLEEVLRADIRATGGRGLPFAAFMERALYHPTLGYYAGGRARVGRSGDFITSASVGECFGMLLAHHVAEAMDLAGTDGGFVIVEQGANDGSLARDILGHLRRRLTPERFARVSYAIVEPFPRLRERQREKLDGEFGGQVRHFSGLGEVAGHFGRGILLCNELLDAFPVHRVAFEGGAWREIHVIEQGGGWAEALGPVSDPRLEPALENLRVADGYRTEVCLALGDWVAEAAGVFASGFVTVIDYGLVEEAYYSPGRGDGTLRGYRNHRLVDDVYAGIGETDLTAHVNFTRLARAARSVGLEVLGFADQGRFLIGQGEAWLREIEAAGPPEGVTAVLLRQFQTLTHPGMMGRAFQVLTLGKNVPAGLEERLSGYRHARQGARALD